MDRHPCQRIPRNLSVRRERGCTHRDTAITTFGISAPQGPLAEVDVPVSRAYLRLEDVTAAATGGRDLRGVS